MNRWTAFLLASTLAAGCGGRTPLDGALPGSDLLDGSVDGAASNPLEGTWDYRSTGTPVGSVSVTFAADGTFSIAISEPACAGTETLAGASWTSTATTVHVSGTESCLGSVVCEGGSIGCGPGTTGTVIDTTCNYTLSNGDNTLTFSTCVTDTGALISPSPATVLTRQ